MKNRKTRALPWCPPERAHFQPKYMPSSDNLGLRLGLGLGLGLGLPLAALLLCCCSYALRKRRSRTSRPGVRSALPQAVDSKPAPYDAINYADPASRRSSAASLPEAPAPPPEVVQTELATPAEAPAPSSSVWGTMFGFPNAASPPAATGFRPAGRKDQLDRV